MFFSSRTTLQFIIRAAVTELRRAWLQLPLLLNQGDCTGSHT